MNMTKEDREEVLKRSNTLRLQLKAWEQEFSAANNVQKPSRDDIKNNPGIAQMYKDYNKTRDILSGKIAPPKQHKSPRKRKSEDGETQGPSKRLNIMKTPSKASLKPWEVDPYDSPNVVRNLFTPAKRTAIGPTPQKDGQVLGLFDLLGTTPEKLENLPGTQASVKATPRKAAALNAALLNSKTPGSKGKRLLDMFATPRKGIRIDGKGGNTPSSISKLHFTTPSFLRRDSHRPIASLNDDDLDLELSPQMVRVPRKPLVRGLSSILAGLRKIEEDAADDDLDALREMEGGLSTLIKPAPKPTVTAPEVQVEGSQQRLPLGGFDDEGRDDSDPEEMKGRDGQPLKVYKKKGQKRTTRRVNMKPTRSKLAAQPTIEEESDDELAAEAVPETQTGPGFESAGNFPSDLDSDEYTASEGGTRTKRPEQRKKTKVVTKDGKIARAGRKVTSLASQNFKRLKLRNSGAKGTTQNSRFRRKK